MVEQNSEHIPYGRQHVDDDDIAAVVNVLKGDWLTQGPAIEQFEQAIATQCDVAHVVAFSSGTAALHAAIYAGDIGPGQTVATSALSFAASAACAIYQGAAATFVDIDPATLNVDMAKVPPGLDGFVPVHYAGLPVDLSGLSESPNRPRVVIEDAAHAIGASTPYGPVGNCAHSDMTCFSFHPVKTITTAEGGAVSTNDDELAERLRRFRHHGIVRREGMPAFYYEIPEAGLNYRVSDMQAALGTSQMAKLGRFIERRNEIAARYRELLPGLPITLAPASPEGFLHGYHLFTVQVDNRDEVFALMREANIGVQVHYVPIYCHDAYSGGATAADLPNTEAAYRRLLSLPMYPDLTDPQQDRVAETLTRCIEQAS